MSKRAKRAKTFLRKQSILGEKIDEAILRRYGLPITEDNSVMQEKLKQETTPTPVVETAPEVVVEPTPEPTPIVEEMVKEVEQLIAEVKAPPKPKPKPRKRRAPTRRKKKAEE